MKTGMVEKGWWRIMEKEGGGDGVDGEVGEQC